MPGKSWDERFVGAIAERADWKAAWDEILATNADKRLIQMLLKNAWSSEADFAEEHRKRLAVALTEGEKLHADIDNLNRQLEKFHGAAREALKEEPEGLECFEQYAPLKPLADQLCNCAEWLNSKALPGFGKHVSGTKLPKNRRGKIARTKQPILRTTDIYMITLLIYLRLIGKDQTHHNDRDQPHHNEVAQLMNAAARASGLPLTWRLDAHWVCVTEKRFQDEHPRIYEVAKGLAAKYVRTKERDASATESHGNP